MKIASRKRAITRSVGLAALGLTCSPFAAPAFSAVVSVHVGSLAVVSGAATGSITGFQPNAKVTINGNTYLANLLGTVALNGAPLGNASVLTIGYLDSTGAVQTTRAPLVDATSGLPLSLAQLNDGIPDVTIPADSSPDSGGGTTTTPTNRTNGTDGTTGSNGSSGTGGSTLTPTGGARLIPGAILLRDGFTSIPATSVVAPYRLVIRKVTFRPRVISTRKRPVTVSYQVTDTRGYLVRGADVYMRSLPLRIITTASTHRTSNSGWVSFTFKPTQRLKMQKGGRVNLFVRAMTPGTSKIGGTSTRRLVSLGLNPTRSK